jgi:hypothetical protein
MRLKFKYTRDRDKAERREELVAAVFVSKPTPWGGDLHEATAHGHLKNHRGMCGWTLERSGMLSTVHVVCL